MLDMCTHQAFFDSVEASARELERQRDTVGWVRTCPECGARWDGAWDAVRKTVSLLQVDDAGYVLLVTDGYAEGEAPVATPAEFRAILGAFAGSKLPDRSRQGGPQWGSRAARPARRRRRS